jgi:hypothetical protein
MVRKIILAIAIGGILITAYKQYEKSKTIQKPKLK